MERNKLSFPVIWAGMINGRTAITGNQTDIFKLLFKYSLKPPEACKHANGGSRFPKHLAISFTDAWEKDPEPILEDIKKLGISQPDVVADAFYAYILNRYDFNDVESAEIEEATASGDPIRFIGAALYCAMYNRRHNMDKGQPPLSKEERDYLKSLEITTSPEQRYFSTLAAKRPKANESYSAKKVRDSFAKIFAEIELLRDIYSSLDPSLNSICLDFAARITEKCSICEE